MVDLSSALIGHLQRSAWMSSCVSASDAKHLTPELSMSSFSQTSSTVQMVVASHLSYRRDYEMLPENSSDFRSFYDCNCASSKTKMSLSVSVFV